MMTENAISNVCDEHDKREQECGQQRTPPGDAADEMHKPRNKQEAREIKPEPLRQQAEQQRRQEEPAGTRRSWSRVTKVPLS